MRMRPTALFAMCALLVSVVGLAAQNTGEIYGKVTDSSGGVLPGLP